MLFLLASLAHAGPFELCPPTRCRLGYLDADAHINEPYASGRYPVVIAVYSGSVRSTVDGSATSSISTSSAVRLGIPWADLAGAVSITAATSSVNLTSTLPGATTTDISVIATQPGTTYQIWIIE